MTALAAAKDVRELASPFAMEHFIGVIANAVIFKGALVALVAASGFVDEGTTSTTIVAVGISTGGRDANSAGTVDNTGGGAGAKGVRIRSGIFKFVNDGTIAQVDVGRSAFIVDDQTVADNDGTGTRSLAGKIYQVDTDGVWVAIPFPAVAI